MWEVLDPWNICIEKDAEKFAIAIFVEMLGIRTCDPEFKIIVKAVREVGKQKEPCMRSVANYLLSNTEDLFVDVEKIFL